jgi:hypothetical protein
MRTPRRAKGNHVLPLGARYQTPADSTLTESIFDAEDFCEAEIDVDRASLLLKIPPSTSSSYATVVGAKLADSRPYVDIVRLPRQAYFYQAPDASKKTAAYVVADDYVAVLRKTADWFLVDFFGKASETRGWIRREDLVHGHWVEQSAKMPQYSFAVACQHEAGSDRISVDALEIKNRSSGQRTQIFYDLNGADPGKCEDVVALEDANFDGYPDLVISAQDNVVRDDVNYSVAFYLFHPERQRFEVHDGLSALTQPEIDPVKREIRAGYRNGATEHGSERYHFAGGRLVLIESEVEKCGGDDDVCDVTTRRLVRGAYVVTKTKRRVEF